MKSKVVRLLLLTIPLLLFIAGCSTSVGSLGGSDPPIPTITQDDRGWVDTTGTVSSQTLDTLRNESDKFHQEGFELAGVFFHDIASDPSQFGSDVANQNGIGSASTNNGLTFLVLLDREGNDNHKPYLFVTTGRGLEAALPDSKVQWFMEKYFFPDRADGKWQQGLVQLADKFAQYLAEPSNQEFADKNLDPTYWWDSMSAGEQLIVIIVTVILAILILIFLAKTGLIWIFFAAASSGSGGNGGSSGGGGYGG